MSEPIIVFIVEGEKRDLRFAKELAQCFFQGRHKVTVINLPASQNIYMLYEKLRADGFETDIVEILRSDVPEASIKLEGVSRRAISQVYLFFDFDPHQDNLTENNIDSLEVISDMLDAFDNETENGKLFISYPMVESLYDYRHDSCQAFTKCLIPLSDVTNYKRKSGDGNVNANARMDYRQWEDVIEVFALRTKCLLDLDSMSFETYRKEVSPKTLFEAERKVCASYGCVFVLSAFPEFILDYFKQDFWNSHVKRTRFSFDRCAKGR